MGGFPENFRQVREATGGRPFFGQLFKNRDGRFVIGAVAIEVGFGKALV